MTELKPMTIAVLGGAGKEGGGLALRMAEAGHRVVIGSRDAARAQVAADIINAQLGGTFAVGSDNVTAAAGAELVLLAVPYSAQRATAEALLPQLKGKILIDVTVPLVPPKVSRVQLPAGGSAVDALQQALGPDVRVVSAFQNISAHHLAHKGPIDCDVLVCSDDREAADLVVALAQQLGMGGLYAGPLANSAATEALTSLLIGLNIRNKVTGAGIRITGLAGWGPASVE